MCIISSAFVLHYFHIVKIFAKVLKYLLTNIYNDDILFITYEHIII